MRIDFRMGLNELADELIEALEFGGHVEHKPEESLDEYRLKSMVVAIQMVTNMSFSVCFVCFDANF